MKDASSKLRTATRRAKSDVANKLVSMFLHELSRKVSKEFGMTVESEEYSQRVRQFFGNRCPYCSEELSADGAVVEHLNGMNRYRAGLHIPGNVLVACRRCNSEKRRDDAAKTLSLARTGWESFLSHDGSRCVAGCRTCGYWRRVWVDKDVRGRKLLENLGYIRQFHAQFSGSVAAVSDLENRLPSLLTRLYTDCQDFAEREIRALLGSVEAFNRAGPGYETRAGQLPRA